MFKAIFVGESIPFFRAEGLPVVMNTSQEILQGNNSVRQLMTA